MWLTIFLVVTSVCSISATNIETCSHRAKGSPYFPNNFSFGVATSAYQIEGAWNEDGRGPSIWDEFTHDFPDKIKDRSNGDTTAESYHRFEQDLQALKEMKVNHYRFSISWTRVFPTGDISSRNQKGIDYYNNVINKLLANGIEPKVTMYHYDLPSEIEKIGGFTNPIILVDRFVAYATELFKIYGDRVKTWITFNEPLLYCGNSYSDGTYPPQIRSPGEGDYICIDTTLKAHAATYQAYRAQFYEKQRGKLGLAVNSPFFFSKSNDMKVVRRGMEFNLGLQIHPVYSKTGGYPKNLVRDIEHNSQKEGRNSSRLPQHDDEWKEILRNSADFLGLNHYSSVNIDRASSPKTPKPSWNYDLDCEYSIDSDWFRGKSWWLYCVPEGLESILKYIRDEYDNVEVIITENGWSDEGELEDDNRIRYLRSYLQAVLNAVNDGCNVSSYSVWSLIDNFEWLNGFTEKFGLYAVNMSSPTKERIPKKSAGFYRKVIETRTIPNEASHLKLHIYSYIIINIAICLRAYF